MFGKHGKHLESIACTIKPKNKTMLPSDSSLMLCCHPSTSAPSCGKRSP